VTVRVKLNGLIRRRIELLADGDRERRGRPWRRGARRDGIAACRLHLIGDVQRRRSAGDPHLDTTRLVTGSREGTLDAVFLRSSTPGSEKLQLRRLSEEPMVVALPNVSCCRSRRDRSRNIEGRAVSCSCGKAVRRWPTRLSTPVERLASVAGGAQFHRARSFLMLSARPQRRQRLAAATRTDNSPAPAMDVGTSSMAGTAA
jgi:hypothetical protein